ncbi:hypothetical protein ARALYDRAFT_910825 [Arabidopsis lyrata subsp. lyrata]|uniref:Uncharacterized protein n=1 Tax=Arabidopsis lyrata subsp. lyrata TaxID=81972 RepID=D7M630_ARALL|nr:hypothetical protein ARALYDRAFT_910825 [Arabidopsis lyrata subsp. lyrata]
MELDAEPSISKENGFPSPVDSVPTRPVRKIGSSVYPWNYPSSARSLPAFEPSPRDFQRGVIKTLMDATYYSTTREAESILEWFDSVKMLHRSLNDRHAELLKQMQSLERGMRMLESELRDWERFELDRAVPMPESLCNYLKIYHHKGGICRRQCRV